MKENFSVQETEPNIYALTNVELIATEEEFFIHLHSGNSIRRYNLTPKHLKRISLLIDREVAKFETDHGPLAAKLPVQKREQKKKKIGFSAFKK